MGLIKLILTFCLALPLCQSYRLPETISPSRYEVDLFIPEEVFRGAGNVFEGLVKITFTALISTSEIKLHHRVSNIINFNLTAGSTRIEASITNEDNVTDIATITVSPNLTVARDYQLTIEYNSTFEETDMRGFYISTYKNESNLNAYMVTTQFQPTHARHAFPCFDEPRFKSTFLISLTYPYGLNALANTEKTAETNLTNNYVKTTYRETTKMSTYLVAFIISEFTCTEGDTISTDVPYRVCSRDEEKADRQWAVEIGTPLLRSLESITGLKYGSYMPKMDQVAIPDFSAGAMENWGLVTYRETGLLFSEEDTSNIYKKNIALVIAHEFTHMWFGDLVTCKWWDYTFLNEGFARYYQYFAAAATKQFVNWELDKHFNVEQLHTALLADSSLGAQALTSPSASPSEVSAKFGTISYNKGASILRMIELNILGPDNFVYGIRHYLDEYQSEATVPANLWSSLQEYVPTSALPYNVNLSTILYSWVEDSGHPVVEVITNGSDVILTQKRFLLALSNDTQYYVPITYTTSNDVTQFSNVTVKQWLRPDQSVTLQGVLSESNWIILNNRQSGFYRVNYDDSLWAALKAQLQSNHLVIDVLNRAQIISDVYNYARSGRNGGYGTWDYSQALSVLSYLENEVDYYPWYAAIIGNNHLLQRIGHDSEEGKQFTTWMLKLMDKVYKSVPFETLDSSNQVYTMKQAMILTRVCKYGEANCISKSKELFAQYKEQGIKVPKNLRSVVYCNALRHSDNPQSDYEFLWGIFQETKLMSEVITILSGLGCVEDIAILKRFLNQTVTPDSGIRLQDFSSAWSYVYTSGKNGTTAALEYIAENYELLSESYSSVGTLITNIAAYIYDEEQLEKLRALAEGLTGSHQQTAQTALNNTITTINWAKTLKEDIKTYFLEEEETDGAIVSKSSIILVLVFIVLQKLLY